MNTWRRFAAGVTSLALLLSVAETPLLQGTVRVEQAYAVSEDYRENDFCYQVEDGNAVTISYIGDATEITVPTQLGGYPVTTIGRNTFTGCRDLEAVTIPAGVTTVAEAAFYNCTALRSVTLPDTVTEIGREAFMGCCSLTTVRLPQGLTALSGGVFQNCIVLQEIDIPDTVREIGWRAFCGCTALEAITLPDSMTALEESTFEFCGSLTTVTIGSGLEVVSGGTFTSCVSLREFIVPPENPYLSAVDGGLCDKAGTLLLLCPGAVNGTVTLPDSIRRIADSAFFCCPGLEKLELGKNLSEIEDNAFMQCVMLQSIDVSAENPYFTSVDGVLYDKNCTTLLRCPSCYTGTLTIPEGVTTICDNALECCYLIEQMVLPDSLTVLNDNIFMFCQTLSSITLGANITDLASDTFRHCDLLSEINVSPDSSAFSSVDGILYDKAGTTLVRCPIGRTDSLTIPDGVTTIAPAAFACCNGLTDVALPDSVTEIGSGAFEGCCDLTAVKLPEGITTIAANTFSSCCALTAVEIPDGVTAIEQEAFSDCAYLSAVTLPDSVKRLGEGAFLRCYGLETLEIGSGLKEMKDKALYDCGIVSFRVSADNGKYSVIDGALYADDNSVLVKCAAGTEQLLLSDGVTEIADYACAGNIALREVKFSDGLLSIGNEAFTCCSGLTTVILPNSVKRLGKYAFSSCNQLTFASLSSSLREIPEHAFYDCESLGVVYLPEGILRIWDSAFESCEAMTSLSIPASVADIHPNAYGMAWNYDTQDYAPLASCSITGFAGSAAEAYAKENGIAFVTVESLPPVVTPPIVTNVTDPVDNTTACTEQTHQTIYTTTAPGWRGTTTAETTLATNAPLLQTTTPNVTTAHPGAPGTSCTTALAEENLPPTWTTEADVPDGSGVQVITGNVADVTKIVVKNNNGTDDVYFLYGVDDLAYCNAGFVLTCGDRQAIWKTETVYRSAVIDGVTYTAADLGTQYLAAVCLSGVPEDMTAQVGGIPRQEKPAPTDADKPRQKPDTDSNREENAQ